MTERLLHASCVSIDGAGVLLMGLSGSGKSDVALRLIDGGAALVSDDQVAICATEEGLLARPPERIAGMLELRGVGIITLPFSSAVSLKLAIMLVEREQVERMPEPAFFDCLGQQLPLLSLHAFDVSICAKIRQYVKGLT